jgi:hypothetical protein
VRYKYLLSNFNFGEEKEEPILLFLNEKGNYTKNA